MAKRSRKTVNHRKIERKKGRKVTRKAPATRGDCENVPRPCPFVGCVYSMFLNITKKGSIQFVNGTEDPTLVPADLSCALDIIEERTSLTLEETGELFNLSKERIRQIEFDAIEKIRNYDLDWERF